MSATLIDGRAIAQRVREEVTSRVERLRVKGIIPRLDVILAGAHGPSRIYVKYKVKAAKAMGIIAHIHHFPDEVNPDVLREEIHRLNESPDTHGILVQLPLPSHIPSQEAWSIVEAVSPQKDVDGLHPFNQGLIGVSERGFTACTPLGCLRLLQETLGDISGKKVVIVGRSRIVGRPLSLLLTASNATVTLCHSKTRTLSAHVYEADIIVAAAGVPHLIRGEWIQEGAVVIDVGIHRGEDGRLYGDVDFESAREVASAITPVPGGVGPMTIASLMHNVCLASERSDQQ